MSYFTVAGLKDCKFFQHTLYLANCLSDHLPNFHVRIIQVERKKWKHWLKEINLKYNWFHFKSPIIWKGYKEETQTPRLIGDMYAFQEYCYDYYGLSNFLDKALLKRFSKDYAQIEFEENKVLETTRNLTFFIIGSNEIFLEALAKHILECESVSDSVKIKIYIDRSDPSECSGESEHLLSRAEDHVTVVQDIQNGIEDADLLILTGGQERNYQEELDDWMSRTTTSLELFCEKISPLIKKTLKVIVGTNGPSCYEANVLASFLRKLDKRNVVAVSADLGLRDLCISCSCSNKHKISASPTWGYVGINHLIDKDHAVTRYTIQRPSCHPWATNPAHEMIRFACFPDKPYDPHCRLAPSLFNFFKVLAIVDLIKHWYSKSCSHVISLGIMSDGTFGIPKGIVFSQPVILKEGYWVPMETFPVPSRGPFYISDLVDLPLDILDNFTMCIY